MKTLVSFIYRIMSLYDHLAILVRNMSACQIFDLKFFANIPSQAHTTIRLYILVY